MNVLSEDHSECITINNFFQKFTDRIIYPKTTKWPKFRLSERPDTFDQSFRGFQGWQILW